MLSAIRSFFTDLFSGSGHAAEQDIVGGGGGGRGFGGVQGFGGFSAEYGSGDFWMTGSHAPGASRELLAAEAAYEQRLHNTIDARNAQNALQRGDTQAAISILNRNPEVGVSIGGVELYGTTGAAFLHTQGEAARVAAQQGIDRTGQIRTNLSGQADSAPGPASATSPGTSSSLPDFDGGVINIPVGASDTQWDVVKRSLAAFAKKADLPVEEQANFVNYWTARLKADGETSLYNYTTSGRQKITAEEFAGYQQRGNFPSYLTPDRQPVIVADLQRRLAEIEGEVVRINVNDAQQRAAQHREGFGAFFDGVVRGDFSDNRSWSTTAGQIVGGLNPLADIRDIAAGVKQVAAGEEGGWLTLGANVAGAIPVGGDAAKAALRVGRRALQEGAEEVAEQTARQTIREGTQAASESVLENTDTLQRRMFNQPTTQGDPDMPAGFGETDRYGNITYSTAGTPTDRALVLNHEKVHQFLSPKFTLLREFRADLRMTAYQRSQFMRYLEEATAETYAQLRVNGVRGLPEGLRFPITNGYVELRNVVAEGAVGALTIGGVTYGAYVTSSAVTESSGNYHDR